MSGSGRPALHPRLPLHVQLPSPWEKTFSVSHPRGAWGEGRAKRFLWARFWEANHNRGAGKTTANIRGTLIRSRTLCTSSYIVLTTTVSFVLLSLPSQMRDRGSEIKLPAEAHRASKW